MTLLCHCFSDVISCTAENRIRKNVETLFQLIVIRQVKKLAMKTFAVVKCQMNLQKNDREEISRWLKIDSDVDGRSSKHYFPHFMTPRVILSLLCWPHSLVLSFTSEARKFSLVKRWLITHNSITSNRDKVINIRNNRPYRVYLWEWHSICRLSAQLNGRNRLRFLAFMFLFVRSLWSSFVGISRHSNLRQIRRRQRVIRESFNITEKFVKTFKMFSDFISPNREMVFNFPIENKIIQF